MNENQIKNLIRVWYEKSTHEQDPFSKFVFLWFCFNAWIAHRSSEDSDRGMMEELANRDALMSDITTAYDALMQATPTVFLTHIQNLVKLSPIMDPRGVRPPTVIADENDFPNIMWGIYKVRCNLFHGGKNAGDPRDQRLVVAAGSILEKLVGGLIGQWRA